MDYEKDYRQLQEEERMNNNNNYNEKQRNNKIQTIVWGGDITYNLRISLIHNTSLGSNQVMSKVKETI